MTPLKLRMRDEAHIPQFSSKQTFVAKSEFKVEDKKPLNSDLENKRIAILKISAKLVQVQTRRLGYIRFLDAIKECESNLPCVGTVAERNAYLSELHKTQLDVITKIVKCDAMMQNILLIQAKVLEN
jgi:hypothetical protein